MSLYRALGSAVEMSGGSAANTMCGVASFGGRAAYIGKVAKDDLGDVFGHDLRAVKLLVDLLSPGRSGVTVNQQAVVINSGELD